MNSILRKMTSYHVYFSPKEGVSPEALTKQVHEFMESQVGHNYALGYRLLKFTNNEHFEGLPNYHLIVDYSSEEELKKGFEKMRAHYKEAPHAPLMTMVSDFKVAFSVDEKPGDAPGN